jgi:RAD51-like protein 1
MCLQIQPAPYSVAGLDVDVLSRLEGHNFRTAEDVLTRSSLDLVELLDISLPTAERVIHSVAKNVCPKPTTARALLLSRSTQPLTQEGREHVAGGGDASASLAASASASDAAAARVASGADAAPSTGAPGSGGPAFVRSHLDALDKALGGGMPTGSISELVVGLYKLKCILPLRSVTQSLRAPGFKVCFRIQPLCRYTVGGAGAGKTQMCLTLAVAAAAPVSAGGLGGGVVFIDTEQKFSGRVGTFQHVMYA